MNRFPFAVMESYDRGSGEDGKRPAVYERRRIGSDPKLRRDACGRPL